jgi:hypothetical protein
MSIQWAHFGDEKHLQNKDIKTKTNKEVIVAYNKLTTTFSAWCTKPQLVMIMAMLELGGFI